MENTKREVTIEDVIKSSVQELSGITFPPLNVQQMSMISENVSQPIERCIRNLRVCLEFFENQRKKAQEAMGAEEKQEEEINEDQLEGTVQE